jgi:myo-inositol-1(or 4)-monophosphatase
MVGRGWLDGYWETRLSPWDLSAGALIVQEAGGCVTGITGERFSSRSGHAIASNGAIHKEILAELAVVGTPSI